MGAEISIFLDVRRAKKNDVYPVKLRVYHDGKPELYGTVFNLNKEDFEKLEAKRMTETLSNIKDQLNEVVKQARIIADELVPFKFDKFFSQFIYRHPLFKQKIKRAERLIDDRSANIVPQEWFNSYPK